MSDKERLEELKEWYNNDKEIHQFQIEWLIEQAEKVEHLHNEINKQTELKEFWKDRYLNENEKLLQLIEEE